MAPDRISAPIGEKEVTRAIARGFMEQLIEYVDSDCLIIGGVPLRRRLSLSCRKV